jgi:CDGSH-type Zn-finger protein
MAELTNLDSKIETYLAGEDEALDGPEFLTIAEAGERAMVKRPSERAGIEAVGELADWAPPVQEKHLATVAAKEDPNETADPPTSRPTPPHTADAGTPRVGGPRTAGEMTVTPYRDGPYLLRGAFALRDQDGNEIANARRVVALCRCGKSRTRPFCDGTHKLIGFRAPSGAERGVDLESLEGGRVA